MNTCFIGIYWDARKENIDTCSEKIYNTLLFMGNHINENLVQWYKTKKPKKGEDQAPISITTTSIKRLLLESRNYNEDDTLNEDLGYTVFLKSRKDFSRAVVLSITCGSYNELIPNSITIGISDDEILSELKVKTLLDELYLELVKIWTPGRGVIRCDDIDLLSESYN